MKLKGPEEEVDGIRKVKQKRYTNNFSKANKIIACVNNCTGELTTKKKQGTGGKRIGQSVGRKPCINSLGLPK